MWAPYYSYSLNSQCEDYESLLKIEMHNGKQRIQSDCQILGRILIFKNWAGKFKLECAWWVIVCFEYRHLSQLTECPPMPLYIFIYLNNHSQTLLYSTYIIHESTCQHLIFSISLLILWAPVVFHLMQWFPKVVAWLTWISLSGYMKRRFSLYPQWRREGVDR